MEESEEMLGKHAYIDDFYVGLAHNHVTMQRGLCYWKLAVYDHGS